MFEKASKQKLRFQTTIGTLNTEDLWALPLEHLDSLAKQLKKQAAESGEESFIKAKSSTNETIELRFSIVKRIIEVKLEEKEAKASAAAKKAQKQHLLELLGQKENEALSAKSADELRAMLKDFD
jgi:hypothetical protein